MSVYDTKFWKKHWDEGVADLPPAAWETTFTSAIRRTFEQHPRMLALEFSGFEMDYGELEDASNRFANGLISRGFVKEIGRAHV
jgi:hypothetical protein